MASQFTITALSKCYVALFGADREIMGLKLFGCQWEARFIVLNLECWFYWLSRCVRFIVL
jgi:hypothetical protein